jgi:hypothetical protein
MDESQREQRKIVRRRYWLALGRFIEQFALTETMVHFALRTISGVSLETARAIFSGVRMNAALGLITRLAETNRLPAALKRELADASAQLGLITRIRNDILHAENDLMENGDLRLTNERAAHTSENLRIQCISAATLDDMTADLSKASAHIGLVAWWQNEHIELMRERDAAVLARAWRYKPPPQDRSPRKPPNKRSARQPRPRSSPP